MSVRTLSELRDDQQELLQQLQAGSARGGVASGGPPPSEPPLRIAKITQMVSSHATYGAHLVVQPQFFSGQPPSALDSTAPPRRAYPTPNRTVTDYAVDEYVALWVSRGAEFALKLA